MLRGMGRTALLSGAPGGLSGATGDGPANPTTQLLMLEPQLQVPAASPAPPESSDTAQPESLHVRLVGGLLLEFPGPP